MRMAGKIAGLALAVAAAGGSAAAEVNMYTDRQEVFLRPVVEAFEQGSGVKVNITFIKKGLFERMKAEGANSRADVVMALDINLLRDFAAAGLTAPVSGDAVLDSAPPDYRDARGFWFGVTRRIRAIYAPKGSGIKTYEELAEPKHKGKICLRSGAHLYNIALFADIIGRHGIDKGEQWLRAIKDNLARKPQGNDRAQIRGVLNGECQIGIANTYYFFQMLRNDKDEAPRAKLLEKVEIIIPEKPSVNVTGVALAKHAPHREDALKLMRFLVGARAQNLYASQNFEFPVSDNAEYPQELQPYKEQLKDAAAPIDTARHRADASRIVESIGFNR